MTDERQQRIEVIPPGVVALPRGEQAVVVPAGHLRSIVERLNSIEAPGRAFSNLGWAVAGMSATCIASAFTTNDQLIRLVFIVSAGGLAGMAILALIVSRRECAHERESAAAIAQQISQLLPAGGYRDSTEDRLRYRATAYLSRIVAQTIEHNELLPDAVWDWHLELSGRHIGLRARRKSDGVRHHAVVQVAPDWAAGTSLSYGSSVANKLVNSLHPRSVEQETGEYW